MLNIVRSPFLDIFVITANSFPCPTVDSPQALVVLLPYNTHFLSVWRACFLDLTFCVLFVAPGVLACRVLRRRRVLLRHMRPAVEAGAAAL